MGDTGVPDSDREMKECLYTLDHRKVKLEQNVLSSALIVLGILKMYTIVSLNCTLKYTAVSTFN